MRRFWGRRLPKPLRIIQAHPRLFLSGVFGVIVGLSLPEAWRPITRGLVAWNAATWTYLIAASVMIWRSQNQDIRRRAAWEDEGRYTILTLAAVASTISLGAIFAQLSTVKGMPHPARDLHIGLAVATIVGSWLFMHLTFALHYAHEFFRIARSQQTTPSHGCITFPGNDTPDYLDFLYFSYVIGVACQTADVSIAGRSLRRLATIHGILAFFYNNAVLAMTINIAAGFIGG